MSEEVPRLKTFTVKCPKCETTLNLKIRLDDLVYEGGISKVAIFHGDPPHSLIVYIDEEGHVRGTEVADFVALLTKKEKLTEEEMKQFESHIGVDTMALMYSGLIINKPLYVITAGSVDKPAEFLRQFLKDYPTKIPILENEIVDEFAISVIDKDTFQNNISQVKKGFIYNMITGEIEGDYEFRYIKNFIRKTINKGYTGLVERFTEAKRLSLLFEKFYNEVLNAPSQVSLKELKKKFNLSNQEARYLMELTYVKNPELKGKIKDDLKILGIF